jgi:EpsI family protein
MKIKKHINFIIATIILSICTVYVYKQIFITPEKTNTSKNKFPSRIANWTADEVIYDKEMLSILDPDKIVYKSYHNNNGHPPITLFISYYNTLEKADLSHSPLVCFTGQGWELEDTAEKEIHIGLSDTSRIRVNQTIQTKLNTTMVAIYWYQSTHEAFASRGTLKLFLFFDKLLGKPENNAFIRVTASVPRGTSIVETSYHLFSFVQKMYPEIEKFFL